MAIAMINTSAYAYASLSNPNKVEKTISLFEAITGLGNAAGPILGSLLYDGLGFTGVFYTFGSL
jgi:predicted MFS family arabinose efflux permease